MNIQTNSPYKFERKPRFFCRKAQAIFIMVFLLTSSTSFAVQPDTLRIMQITDAPKIDGLADDAAWQKAQWIPID